MAGPQVEVIGVGQQDADAEVVREVALREAFDRGLRADRHEDRGFDGSVRQYAAGRRGRGCEDTRPGLRR